MRFIDNYETNSLLSTIRMTIGSWNQIEHLNCPPSHCYKYIPENDPHEIYILAKELIEWFNESGWIIYKFDNSTFPSDDEISTFETIFLDEHYNWDITEQNTLLFNEKDSTKPSENKKLHLLIFFSIMFEWHAYIVSENSSEPKRLGLIDGVVYFMGDKVHVEQGEQLIKKIFGPNLNM